MPFPLDLTVPTAWNGPTPKSKVQCHGISPSGDWIGGTCLKLGGTPFVNTSQEFAYRYSPFAPSWYEPQPLSNDLTASCRGISDHGDRVGFRLRDPSDPSSTIAILHEQAGNPKDLPFGQNDVSSAMGENASLFSGSFFIVGWHMVPGQRAKGFGITYTKLGGFGPEILLGADIPPSPTEDVNVQCINLQGDLIATLVNNPDGSQRQFIGFRVLAPLPGHPLNHGYKWHPLLQQPDFPVDPNTVTILGINSHGDISGFISGETKTSGFTVNAKLNGTALKLSGFSTYDHPLATFSTQFSGISEAGWIAGTYDSIHPFVFIPWHFSLLKYLAPHWHISQDGPPHTRPSSHKDWARYNSQVALQIHELIQQINDDASRREIEKPLLEFLGRQIKLLSSL
jgi:hypothetical protein